MDHSTTNSPANQVLSFQFHGNAWEYFRIWIVNVCLTAITLGLYSPWAKVRQRRYFYGSTELAGARFDYVANPVVILKGRLIAVAVLIAFGAASEFMPAFSVFVWLAFIFAMPWLIIRTLRFNLANTVYRSIRFGFNAGYGEAFMNYVIMPFIFVPLSLGFAYPWTVKKQTKFRVERSSYGDSRFDFTASTGDFWVIFLRSAGLMALILVAFVVPAAVFFASKVPVPSPLSAEGMPRPEIAAGLFLGYLMLLVLLITVGLYLSTALANLVWQRTTLVDIGFRCQLSFIRLLWLHASNVVAIVLSLGLLIPWAQIRMVRYRLKCMSVCCEPEALNRFLAGQKQDAGSFGEELSDMLDIDIGL